MPFTDPWSDIIPDDSTLADLLGADIRQLRLDIHERMNTLVVDWTTDPLVVKPTLLGLNGAIVINHPYNAIIGPATMDHDNGLVTLAVGNRYGMQLRVPAGCTITSINYLAFCTAAVGSQITAKLNRRQFANGSGAAATINTTVINTNAIQITPSGGIFHLVDSGYYYWIEFITTDTNQIYSVQINVSRDSNDHST